MLFIPGTGYNFGSVTHGDVFVHLVQQPIPHGEDGNGLQANGQDFNGTPYVITWADSKNMDSYEVAAATV